MIKRIKAREKLLSYQTSSQVDLSSDDQALVFALTRDLVKAQFYLADEELTKRLWHEVADLNLSQERIINLMYRCYFHEDDQQMLDADREFTNKI